MARRFEKTRLSGDAGQLKGKLHSGEIVHDKVIFLENVFSTN